MIDIPKYASRYEKSELTLFLLKDKAEDKIYNFLSLIELCPYGLFPSEWIQGKKSAVSIHVDERHDFIIDKFPLGPKEAIEYYAADLVHAVHGNPTYEIHDFGNCVEQDCGKDGILIHDDFRDAGNALKEIVPKYRIGTRVFYKLCLADKPRTLFQREQFQRCFAEIANHCNISLYDKQEYWGALVLCLPDYLLQEFHSKLGNDKKTLLTTIFPWKNRTIENLTLLLSNERKEGTGFFFSTPLASHYNFVSLPQTPDTLHAWLYHTDAKGHVELLEESRGTFTNQIAVGMTVKGKDIRYHVNGRVVSAEGSTYTCQSIGEGPSVSRRLINDNEEKRYLENLEKSKTFIYYDGTDDRARLAKKTVKDLLKTAQKLCVVCDPYFSRSDFENYLLPLTGKNCLIQIITTENKLATRRRGGVLDKAEGQRFQDFLSQLEAASVVQSKVECYVLNEDAPLHDRFFIMDGTAYLMGSSLNHFGEKATTLYKTPSAKIMQREAEIMMKQKSRLLSDWLTA